MNTLRLSLRLGWLLLAILPLTGCVNVKYRAAPKSTPAATALNLSVMKPPVEAVLHTVVVFHGPGSWKRDAYWDEYVVSLTNRGGTPLVLEMASLTDFTGTSSAASDNPWLLESQSRTREAELKAKVKNVVVQVGSGYVGVSLAATGALAVGGFLGGVIALPAYVAGHIYVNVHSREKIQDEFTRRRLALPATIAPGATVQGSFFFRISPSPRHLSMLFQQDGAYDKVLLDLTTLAGLHLAGPDQPDRGLPPEK